MPTNSPFEVVSESAGHSVLGRVQRTSLRGKYWRPTLVFLAVMGISILAAMIPGPIHSAVQLGGDEFFEVTKGLLWAHGYAPYRDFWNDQPPLHTAFLTLAFKCFGPTIGVARGLAAGFGLSLLLALFFVVKKRCGPLAASIASAFLLTSPIVFGLCVSVMLEAPAIGTALWALWAVYQWREKGHWGWLVTAGILLAAAMQIKMTAGIIGPALVLEILLASQSRGARPAGLGNWIREATRNLMSWGGGFAAAFLLLGFALGGNYELLWASHFSSEMLDELSEADSHAFSFGLLVDHTEALWGLGAGLLVVAVRRDWPRMAFPLAMILTVTAIHFHHRPWWPYYYLHFAVPIAWLTGHGIAELLRAARARTDELLGPMGNLLAASGLIALVMFCGGSRLLNTLGHVEDFPRMEDNALIAKMKEYAGRTKWVFTRGSIYPFHAGLMVIPELAVIPAKRIWSGRLTDEKILAVLKRYQPEQVLLEKVTVTPATEDYVYAGYVPVYEDETFRLYVAKSLAGK
jgi:hypothetical protein